MYALIDSPQLIRVGAHLEAQRWNLECQTLPSTGGEDAQCIVVILDKPFYDLRHASSGSMQIQEGKDLPALAKGEKNRVQTHYGARRTPFPSK